MPWPCLLYRPSLSMASFVKSLDVLYLSSSVPFHMLFSEFGGFYVYPDPSCTKNYVPTFEAFTFKTSSESVTVPPFSIPNCLNSGSILQTSEEETKKSQS